MKQQNSGYKSTVENLILWNCHSSLPSGHFALQDLEASLAENIEVANTLGLKAIYVPYLQEKDRPTNTAGYKALAQRLMVLNEKIRVAGFEFGWHNHDFEMVALADGGIPMDVLLTEAQGISWEADLAWVHYANADPFEWVAKYGSRLSAVHIKDAAAKGQNLDEDGWADVGEGVIEWKSLLEKIYSVAPDALLIMEHDKPSNAVRFASTSIKNFSSY